MIVKGGVPIRRIPKTSSVSIQAGQRVFHKRADGSYEPASITLRAEVKNVMNPKYAWGRIVNGIFQSNGVIYNTLVVNPAYTGVIAVRVRGDNMPNYIEEYTSISVVDDGAPAVQYKIVVKQLENIVTSIPCDANGSPKIYYQATAHLYKVTGDVEELCADYVCVVGYQKNGNTISTVTSDSYTSSLTFNVSGDYESVRIGFTDGTNVIADVTIPKLYDGQPGVTYSIEVTRGSTRITALSCNADGSLKGLNEFEGKFYKTIGNKKETCGLKFIIYGYKSDGSLGIVFHCSTTVGGFSNMYFVDKNWNEYEGILVSCYEGNDRKNIICELMLPKIIDGQSGEAGQKGQPGCAIRRSEWKAGVTYRNDESLNAVTRYLDIVMVRAKNSIGWRGYKCLQTHVSAESNKPGNATYWEELPTNTVGILASLIIARDAKLDFLSGNEIRILDANDKVTAGVSGSGSGETGIRFYAGSDDPQNAPFRVDEKGKVIAENGEFRGKVETAINGNKIVIDPENSTLRMTSSDGDDLCIMEFDNPYPQHKYSKITLKSIDMMYAGRRYEQTIILKDSGIDITRRDTLNNNHLNHVYLGTNIISISEREAGGINESCDIRPHGITLMRDGKSYKSFE